MDEKKNINFLFRRVDPDHLKKLLERELSDQVPCFYKEKYEDAGLEMYLLVVIDSVSDFVFYDYTTYDEAVDRDEEYKNINAAIITLFKKDIIKYYNDSDCSNYIKQDMFESKINKKSIGRLRRIQELRNSIEYQMEVQNPVNFDDAEEYADFCIYIAMCFFYKDEDCSDEYEIDYDLTDNQEEREEVENLMYKEYYDILVDSYEQYMEGG